MSADGKDTQEEQDYWPHRNYGDEGGGLRYEVPQLPKRMKRGMYPITSWDAQVRSEKNAAFGALINICLPGIGVVYAGHPQRGEFIIFLWLLFLQAMTWLATRILFSNTILYLAVFLIGYLLFVIESAMMSSNYCEENNRLWYQFQDSLVKEIQKNADD